MKTGGGEARHNGQENADKQSRRRLNVGDASALRRLCFMQVPGHAPIAMPVLWDTLRGC